MDLLEPLTKDTTDFVRQGAFIAAAMILIQHNEKSCPKVATYRALYEKVITAKHEDAMARFGAVLSQGIIDAGGRNVTISLLSGGQVNMESVVGMVLFTQFWYWFPLAHFMSLAFTPTALIGLDDNLQVYICYAYYNYAFLSCIDSKVLFYFQRQTQSIRLSTHDCYPNRAKG